MGVEGIIKATMADIFMVHRLNFMVSIIGGLIALMILVIVGAVWGVLTLIGFVLFMAGFLVIIANRGKRAEAIFFILIILGIVFIILNVSGVSIMTVDLTVVPGLKDIHGFFN